MAIFGTSILVKLAMPHKNAPAGQIASLLGTILYFLNETWKLPSTDVGGIIEQIKSRFLHPWVQQCAKNHPYIFISAIMPNPAEELKMFGHWDFEISTAERLCARLNQLHLLGTYGLISINDWLTVLPFYCDQVRDINVSSRSAEFKSLSEILCKVLESDIDLALFEVDQMWSFLRQQRPERSMDYISALTQLSVIVPFREMMDLYSHYLGGPYTDQAVDNKTFPTSDEINDKVSSIGLQVVEASERRVSPGRHLRTEIAYIRQILDVLAAQIVLRDGVVQSRA